MANIITLPSGNTATLRDPKSLKQKDRVKVYAANGDPDAHPLVRRANLTAAVISIMVEEWSFDLIPPSVRIASLDELSTTDYDALSEASEIAIEVIFPNLKQTPESEQDPKADGDSSNA